MTWRCLLLLIFTSHAARVSRDGLQKFGCRGGGAGRKTTGDGGVHDVAGVFGSFFFHLPPKLFFVAATTQVAPLSTASDVLSALRGPRCCCCCLKNRPVIRPTPAPKIKAEAYHGQVTEGKLYEGEDDADDGENWFSGPLKFKRHIDDDLRKGSDGRRADDYAVIDPLKQPGGSGTGNGGHGGGGRGGGSGSGRRHEGGSRNGGGGGSGGRDGRDRKRGKDMSGRDMGRSDRRR